MGFNTDLLHAGVLPNEKKATLPPIYQSSAFYKETAGDLAGVFGNTKEGYCYTRVANPTVTEFENRITKIEKGVASVACASGMAALTNALLNILCAGDEIISSASLYGGTIDLFRDMENFGIKTRYVKSNNWDEIENAFNEHTKVVFAETIGNPGLDVTDIEKLSEITHKYKVPLIIDNTTATPYLIRVLEHGADIVINSSSKYINGSSNSVGGILTDGGKFKWDKERYPVLSDYFKFGPFAYIARMRATVYRNMGACLSPVNAYLNVIGLETLGLRLERQCFNALKLAEWLEENYKNIKVNYPGLKSSPYYEIASSQLENGYGAIITLNVGNKDKAFQLIDNLNIPYTLSNVGDTKTLVIHPASTISLNSTEEEKKGAGVTDDLIRISVGIEDVSDLIEDFKNAIDKLD